jgi:DNA-binding MarR family transcriptional regulator
MTTDNSGANKRSPTDTSKDRPTGRSESDDSTSQQENAPRSNAAQDAKDRAGPEARPGEQSEPSDQNLAVDHSDLSAFQLRTLAVIAAHERGFYDEDETYGLSIKRALEEVADEEINYGRLYPNLDELVDDGLVAKRELDKRTNGYELTDAGDHLLREHGQWLLGCLGRDAEVVR